ncbi:MAG: hypothetical protein SAK29_29350 [Scytonema sp. PMC 1069.18]|nr:hypothetical protein [Scytonema sp. PMC 1069.18]MEC4887634.1 hypothetical protein [Scytonema sp. PMC 1070.18]
MSPDEQNIVGFVKLIESQPSLFSSSDQTLLWELVSTLPNDPEQISNAIALWCKSRPHILNELMPLIANVKENDLELRAPKKDVKSPDPKDYNDILLNAVRVSFPNSTPQQPPNQNPSNSQS